MSPTPIELRDIAKVVRRDVLTMTLEAGSGHIGGSLSAVDLLVVLYWEAMKVNPERPQLEERDRFVLSKAHASPALYATLARRGYFNVQELLTFRKLKSVLGGKMRMASAEETLAVTGFRPGGVCPFGLEGIDVCIDAKLGTYETIYPAAGTDGSGVPMTFGQLCEITSGRICDVCDD